MLKELHEERIKRSAKVVEVYCNGIQLQIHEQPGIILIVV